MERRGGGHARGTEPSQHQPEVPPQGRTLATRFRLNCKRLFLTYPQCPVPRDVAAQQIKDKLQRSGVDKLVVGQEEHQDGGHHLHVAVELERRCNVRRSDFFDLSYEDDVYHGKYEKMKGSLAKAAAYCTKDDSDALVEGVNLVALAHATKSKKKYLAKEVMEGKKLEQVIKENPDCLFEHYQWQRSVNSFKLATVVPSAPGGVRGLWFFGQPNTGKSHRAREISLREFNQTPFSKDTSKWWDGYDGEKVVIIDDIDPTFATVPGMTNRLKLWTDRYAVRGEIKGGTIPLAHVLRLLTSNPRPEDIGGKPQ